MTPGDESSRKRLIEEVLAEDSDLDSRCDSDLERSSDYQESLREVVEQDGCKINGVWISVNACLGELRNPIVSSSAPHVNIRDAMAGNVVSIPLLSYEIAPSEKAHC